MDAGDWVASFAAVVSLVGAWLAYVGAKRGASATLTAAREAAQIAQINTLLDTAKVLCDSPNPADKALGYAYVRGVAGEMGTLPNAPALIRRVTRNAPLQAALDEMRRLEDESGEPPQVVVEDQEEES